MTSELQIQKLDRAFDQLDANSNGQIEHDDVIGLGSRLILGFGQTPTSSKGKEVLERYEALWTELATFSSSTDEVLSPAEFRNAMIAAYIEGNRAEQTLLPLGHSVAKLADTDGDGAVGPAEFRTLQSAFGTSDDDSERAFAALDAARAGKLSVEELAHAVREYYTSSDPKARGNQLFGPL